jgi:hypothetical protein
MMMSNAGTECWHQHARARLKQQAAMHPDGGFAFA